MTRIRFEFIRVIRDIRGEKPSLITPAIKSHHGLSESVELPVAEIMIGTDPTSPTEIAMLDVNAGQTCRLACKVGTYGYAMGEGEPLESGIVQFRVETVESQ